jgi:membrane fusion protein (multidrug efflux system)
MSQEPPEAGPPQRSRLRRALPLLVPAAALAIAVVAYGPLHFYLTHVTTDDAHVSGTLVAVAPSVPGHILGFDVREGDTVSAGRRIARLRDDLYRAEVLQAEAFLERARSRLVEAEIGLEMEEHRAEPLAARDESDVMAAQARLAAARAALEQSASELKRIQRLSDSNLVSSAELDDAVARHRRYQAEHEAGEEAVRRAEATRKLTNGHLGPLRIKQQQIAASEADLSMARAALEAARIRLDGTQIRSPVNGIVARTVARPGERVDEGQTVALVRDLDTLWVEANVSEAEIRKVREGQPVSISVDAFPGCTFSGSVVSIGTATASQFALIPQQSAGGNFVKVVQRVPVRISISDPECRLKMGLSAVVSINVSSGD